MQIAHFLKVWHPFPKQGYNRMKQDDLFLKGRIPQYERVDNLLKDMDNQQFLLDPRFEPTTSGYKSDALSIRPRLPLE